ncbi:hypothetical protein BHM03_00046083 [Ensete ventricosum]|nr:hypothetical protein BHM03_00046083 [Ensete ventricosum]
MAPARRTQPHRGGVVGAGDAGSAHVSSFPPAHHPIRRRQSSPVSGSQGRRATPPSRPIPAEESLLQTMPEAPNIPLSLSLASPSPPLLRPSTMRQQQQLLVYHLLILLRLWVPLPEASGAATGGVGRVVHIRSEISSLADKGPAAAPPKQTNLTSVMARKGCGTFAGLLASTADAEQTFMSNVDAGLTVFCPLDQAMKTFLPKFKNLTADGKLSLLLYHAVPVYYSISLLKTGNGVMNTLATDGTARNYNLTVQNEGEQVTLKTRLTVSTITATLIDKDPLAVYAIDKVLEPAELFKPPEAPAPAPAPEADKMAEAPKARKSRRASPPAPAGPEGQPADQKAADESTAGRTGVAALAAAVIATAVAVIAA